MAKHTLWLAQWNRKWNVYALIGGHKRAHESFREWIIREIEEELSLRCGIDFEVADEPAARLEYTAFSKSAQEETGYTMELFDVRLTDSAGGRIDAKPNNRWLTEQEIQSQRTTDGKPVSETVELILRKLGVSPPNNVR
ncbi:MAG: NUDIX domain-containing protein [Pirellulaceae bacterium]